MTVYLIGAGPGDPGLLTVRGHAILQTADVIIYDRLIADDLLALAKPDALLIDAGKTPYGRKTSQATINALLIEHGLTEKTVARLKGGDPFVFGRGGEELEACKAAGVPVEVVPGVSSAIAVPAYGGVPVTQRNISTSFAVVTGHETPEKEASTLNYAALAQMETLVFLMGVRNLPEITTSLMEYGRAAETPVACVEQGTLPEQRVITGTLATISTIAVQENLQSPAVIIIGEVAGFAHAFAWQKSSPLADKRVWLVKSHCSEVMRNLLVSRGARVVRNAPAAFKNYPVDYVIVPDLNSVPAFLEESREFGLLNAQIITAGAGTFNALCDAGYVPSAVPDSTTPERLVQSVEQLARVYSIE